MIFTLGGALTVRLFRNRAVKSVMLKLLRGTMTVKNKTERCMNCKWDCKGYTCPISNRLHEPSPHLKMWSLNRTNFGCNLWEPKGTKAAGSVLDKLDHTKRLELVKERTEWWEKREKQN